jgi:carbamoyl-phosphate synthase small subunit
VLTEACLTLDDGTVFLGQAVGENLEACGEVIFITAMNGYQEVLTDPSYHGQIVVFTTAHVGNYGTNPGVNQAPEPQVAGVIFHELWLPDVSHWYSLASLPSWLGAGRVTALTGVDTRRLTLYLREKGSRNGFIGPRSLGSAEALRRAQAIPSMNGLDLAIRVSCRTPYKKAAIPLDQRASLITPSEPSLLGGAVEPERLSPTYRVAVLDFGVKASILEKLAFQNFDLTIWPGNTPATLIAAEKPQGLFLANGPGDPAACDYAIQTTRAFLGRIPIFGICLGHQIMGLAAGAKTYKLPFGHHGLNHPVHDLDRGRVLITSQNHGFCVDPDTLPAGVRANMWNLNDATVEGLEFSNDSAFCVQFHPEASPGPHDSHGLFSKFRALIEERNA